MNLKSKKQRLGLGDLEKRVQAIEKGEGSATIAVGLE